MRMATRELRRRPRAYLVPTGILLLLALLLLYPSTILDGIIKYSTAAIEHAPADLIVYARDANGVQVRSQITPEMRRQVQDVDGVTWVATYDAAVFTGRVDGRPESESLGFAVMSSDQPMGPIFPKPGEALVDESFRGVRGIEEGATLLLGPFRVPVTIVGFSTNTDLWLLGGVVVDKDTWLEVFGQSSPVTGSSGEEAPGEGAEAAAPPAEASQPSGSSESSGASESGSQPTPSAEPPEPTPSTRPSQALFVSLEHGVNASQVAEAIDEATRRETETFTRKGAVEAMPGVREQAVIFGYIKAVTLAVALVVVGLFLSFLTLERTPLYAVLKAVGASSRQLFFGVVGQALAITAVAVSLAVLLTMALNRVPLGLPTVMRFERVVETLVALGVTAVLGSIVSLRRVVRIDPASAIG
jgi:putative ABC transport system permease protein